jgi:hypothetical protein
VWLGAAAGVKGKKQKWVYDTRLGTGSRYGQSSQTAEVGKLPDFGGRLGLGFDVRP